MTPDRRRALLGSAAAALLAATVALMWTAGARPAEAAVAGLGDVVPAPVSVQPAAGVSYTLPSDVAVATHAGSAPAAEVGAYLAGILRRSTGYAVPVAAAGAGTPTSGIALLLSGADASVGAEGYQLDVTAAAVVLRAQTAAGLFHGVQTLRQLFPPEVESASVRPGPWTLPGGRIVDQPRFPYRGAMLDVARHFHGVETVKRFLDEVALYKINYLHLHLSDDQGWRIAVDAWPRLASHGGSTQVGGGAGGYYTKAQYQEIVAHAAARHITIVPEIDMPGHTNAALASYAELNCNNTAPPLYTGTEVGFSSLCVGKEVTYTFVEQVLTELAALTPGPYLHIGGDEANSTSQADYDTFMKRVQPMVAARGKSVMGWHQLASAAHSPGRVAQFWGTGTSDAKLTAAVQAGAKVVLSPANKAYLDMKYTWETPIGLTWAGLIEVQTAYGWDPGSYLSGVPASAVLGVEAPMWTETITKLSDIEFMAFPRLPALAELGWSPASARNWEAFRVRLGAQGPRWSAMGINFYRSPQVPWAPGSSPGPTGSPTGPAGPCDAPAWSATTAYTGGAVVSHLGRRWTARWWTQGDTPGGNQVWTDSGPCGTASPSASPTRSPSASPSSSPTGSPTASPTGSPTASPTAGPNGLANGGFEAATLAPWTGARCTAVTAPVRSGGRALAGGVTAGDLARCEQVVAVRPNTSYRLAAHVNGGYVYLGATGTGVQASTWTGGTGGGYAPLGVSFTTGASTTSVTVYLHGWYGQPVYHADDVTLTAG